MNRADPFFLAIFLPLLSAVPASAYIDPGTGSYIFQVIIGFLIAAVFSLKLFWRKIRSVISSFFKQKDDKTS